jgi:hypothetical protein
MIKKFHKNIFKDSTVYLLVTFLLALTLNACGVKPAESVPTQQPIATIEVTSFPSPTSTSSIPSDAYSPVFLPLVTKPDAPPQTINGVTVVIDWAYADESRVAIHYVISGLAWPDHTEMPPPTGVRLSGKDFSDTAFGGGSSMNSPVNAGRITGFSDQMLTANAVDTAHPPFVNLQVDIPVDGTGAFVMNTPAPGQTQEPPATMALPNIGTFHFEFEIPIYKGVKVTDINQTVAANGVAMTLKSLILNRSHVDALLCFQMPSAQPWGFADSQFKFSDGQNGIWFQPSSSLLPGDFSGQSTKMPENTDPERCAGMGFDALYDGSPTTVTLTIPKLTTGLSAVPERIPEDLIKKANERLADKGIAFEVIPVDHGNNFNILKRPDGMSDMELYPLIWDAFADWHEGPWVFAVNVKPEK